MLTKNRRLVISDVSFEYRVRRDRVLALRGVSLTVDSGEVVCLSGESGSGKSTLINIAAGLDVPRSGAVEINGVNIAQLKQVDRTDFRLRNIGVVFQDHNLIPEFTALENLLLVLRCQGRNDRDEAKRLLDLVGIGDLSDRLVTDMSGGQRQRVGIARALAGGRNLLLCDEPTGSLDRSNAERVYDTLAALARDEGVGVLIASHDPVLVEQSDRVIRLVEGRIERES